MGGGGWGGGSAQFDPDAVGTMLSTSCVAAAGPSASPLMRAPPAPHLPPTSCIRSFIFHYAVGAQLARYVRLHTKLQPQASPAFFLAGVLLSSTVVWQATDALM